MNGQEMNSSCGPHGDLIYPSGPPRFPGTSPQHGIRHATSRILPQPWAFYGVSVFPGSFLVSVCVASELGGLWALRAFQEVPWLLLRWLTATSWENGDEQVWVSSLPVHTFPAVWNTVFSGFWINSSIDSLSLQKCSTLFRLQVTGVLEIRGSAPHE